MSVVAQTIAVEKLIEKYISDISNLKDRLALEHGEDDVGALRSRVVDAEGTLLYLNGLLDALNLVPKDTLDDAYAPAVALTASAMSPGRAARRTA